MFRLVTYRDVEEEERELFCRKNEGDWLGIDLERWKGRKSLPWAKSSIKKKEVVTKDSLSNDTVCVEEGEICLHSFLASRLVENCLRTRGRKLLALWKDIQ
jgi:hypothetical protein